MINAGNNSNFQSLMARREYQYIISALDRSSLDVIGLGVWDAALGLDTVKKVAGGAATDIICANIDGFLPYLRFNKAGGKLKVLVTSVIDPQLVDLFKLKDIVVTDPLKAVHNLQKTIKHDLFILILHAQGDRIQELLAQISGVDLVIDGGTGRVEKDVKVIYSKPVVCNNFGGKYISYVDLLREPEKSSLKTSSIVFNRVSKKEVVEDPEIKSLVAKYDEERRIFVQKERERRRKERFKPAKVNPSNLYLGSNWCGSCHGDIEKKWHNSRHAQAISSLKKKKREHDPECLVCHVTGLGDKKAVGGFVSVDQNLKMAGVQCEACHGPGGKHAQFPHKEKMKVVTEQSCRVCHNQETDPDFTYQHGLSIVDHGKEVKIVE